MTMLETIDRDMTGAITLLHPVATMNSNPKHNVIYCAPKNGAAIAGFRREVANFGVCLVKAQFGKNVDLKVGSRWETRPGFVSYRKQDEYFESDEGLEGETLENGVVEINDYFETTRKMEAARMDVEDGYAVGLNPGRLLKFIEKSYRSYGTEYENKKLNMQFTAGDTGTNQYIGRARLDENGYLIIRHEKVYNGQLVRVDFQVSNKSRIHVTRIIPGFDYVVAPAGISKEGVRFVDVLRPYSSGVQVAIQNFKMGIIKPGDPGYEVTANKNNGISPKHQFEMPFLPGQKKSKIRKAPMMVFDLDVMHAVFSMLGAYDVVEMKFKNSDYAVYMIAEGNEYLPTIEVLLGATIERVRGRIWLP